MDATHDDAHDQDPFDQPCAWWPVYRSRPRPRRPLPHPRGVPAEGLYWRELPLALQPGDSVELGDVLLEMNGKPTAVFHPTLIHIERRVRPGLFERWTTRDYLVIDEWVPGTSGRLVCIACGEEGCAAGRYYCPDRRVSHTDIGRVWAPTG